MSRIRGELADAKLKEDCAALLLYGLLDALFRPSCARDGEEEIRCRPCRSLVLPLSLVGGPIAMASECSIGIAIVAEPSASIIMSDKALAMVGHDVGF